MSNIWSQISLIELHALSIESFRQGGGSRPDVKLLKYEQEYAVLKDQSSADAVFAFLLGPLLTWRECKALKRLDSHADVPSLLAQPSSRAFVMQYCPSTPVTRIDGDSLDWQSFFSLLNASIVKMHALGIAHNDLRNASNILVSADGKPVLVDLVAAFGRGARWNWLNRLVFDKFCLVDRSAMTKLKQRVAPHLINDTDVHAEQIAGRFGLAIKQLGQAFRKISRLLFTRKSP